MIFNFNLLVPNRLFLLQKWENKFTSVVCRLLMLNKRIFHIKESNVRIFHIFVSNFISWPRNLDKTSGHYCNNERESRCSTDFGFCSAYFDHIAIWQFEGISRRRSRETRERWAGIETGRLSFNRCVAWVQLLDRLS